MKFLLICSIIIAVTCSYSNVTDNGHRVTHIVWFEISIGNQKIPGRIVFGLFSKVVPVTARNFFFLSRRSTGNGYKGSKIHCIIKDKFIAGGAWLKDDNDMQGRSAYDEPEFDNENFKIKLYGAGWVCSDSYGKDAHTSFFIITLKKISNLDNCVGFGKVISGMPIVRDLAMLPTKGVIPKVDVVISNCGGYLANPPFFVPKTDAIV